MSRPPSPPRRTWLHAPRTFGDKITLLVTAISGFAVILVSSLLAASDYRVLQRETLDNLQSQADMVSFNSAAPLAFDDRERGAEALGALRVAPRVAAAALFTADGAPFARYRRQSDPPPDFPQTGGRQREGRWLVLNMPVIDRGEVQGRLQLVYDLEYVYRRLWSSLIVAIAVAALSMLLAWFITRRIQRGLVAPIDELVRTATAVSGTRDYARRAARLSDDELGGLTDAFNGMLGEIQQQQGELESSEAQREAAFVAERAARTEAERASRLKDDFIATLSHELRTPLTPILGWVEVLRRTGAHDARTVQGLEAIERNARAQTQIIDDLLDMSRIVSGKLRLAVEPVDLGALIESALATVRPAADARGVRLETQLESGVGALRGDPNRLQQVIWNLLSNAIKFTERGGRVQVSLRRVEAQAEISVSDSGQGISDEFLPHVFERFRQADSSITRAHGGLGLGLAIVKQLVELHGGSVGAESPGLNRGARFSVRLPMSVELHDATTPTPQAPRGARGPAPDAPPVSLAGRRLLIVDDDDDARELLCQLLEHCGASVLGASSAVEALELLELKRPDALLSDIGMPAMDGYELMRRIRAMPAARGGATPAIALTAFARAEDRQRALGAGYQLHVAKPVEPDALIAALAKLVAAGTDSAGSS